MPASKTIFDIIQYYAYNFIMKIAVIAGEKSGDNYGAYLIDALRRQRTDISILGTGGESIREKSDIFIEGMPSGQMGFSGVVSRLPLFYRAFNRVKDAIEREKPSFIVFIDNPGFNLKLAEVFGRHIPCFYYIPPKVWAHNYQRVKTIKKNIRAVIAIFPFEREIYEREGIPVVWFGHPVQDLINKDIPQKEAQTTPVMGLLPGSREEEVKYLLPVFLRLARKVSAARRVKVALSASDKDIRKTEEAILNKYPSGAEIEIREGNPHNVITESSIVLAASGTVNLEVALFKRPLLVFYKTTALNYLLARLMVKLEMVSPVNLLAGERVVPEYIQRFPYSKIAGDITEILDKGRLYQREMAVFTRLESDIRSSNVSAAVAAFLMQETKKR